MDNIHALKIYDFRHNLLVRGNLKTHTAAHKCTNTSSVGRTRLPTQTHKREAQHTCTQPQFHLHTCSPGNASAELKHPEAPLRPERRILPDSTMSCTGWHWIIFFPQTWARLPAEEETPQGLSYQNPDVRIQQWRQFILAFFSIQPESVINIFLCLGIGEDVHTFLSGPRSSACLWEIVWNYIEQDVDTMTREPLTLGLSLFFMHTYYWVFLSANANIH